MIGSDRVPRGDIICVGRLQVEMHICTEKLKCCTGGSIIDPRDSTPIVV